MPENPYDYMTTDVSFMATARTAAQTHTWKGIAKGLVYALLDVADAIREADRGKYCSADAGSGGRSDDNAPCPECGH